MARALSCFKNPSVDIVIHKTQCLLIPMAENPVLSKPYCFCIFWSKEGMISYIFIFHIWKQFQTKVCLAFSLRFIHTHHDKKVLSARIFRKDYDISCSKNRILKSKNKNGKWERSLMLFKIGFFFSTIYFSSDLCCRIGNFQHTHLLCIYRSLRLFPCPRGSICIYLFCLCLLRSVMPLVYLK